jgi:hypothetical protein
MTQAAFHEKHLRVLFLWPLKTSDRLRHNTRARARHVSEPLPKRQNLPVAWPLILEGLCLAAITSTLAVLGAAQVVGRWLWPGQNNDF